MGTIRCLKETLGKARLTYEELLTVLTKVVYILNSRPLTYLYLDDLQNPLTPSQLISGRRMLSLLDVTRSGTDISSTREKVTTRARYLQKSNDHFWNRRRQEYIRTLRESQKLQSQSTGRAVQMGDIDCTLLITSTYQVDNWSRA